MKKNLLITLIGAATLLSACGKESEFKSAINKSIETDYNCLNLSSSGFVPWMDNKELEGCFHPTPQKCKILKPSFLQT